MRTNVPPPEVVIIYGYKVELYSYYICIYDPNGKLTKEGSKKIATWLDQEGVKTKPFDVKVFKATQ